MLLFLYTITNFPPILLLYLPISICLYLSIFVLQAVQNELEHLRDDHLTTLRREVEARIAALKSMEQVIGSREEG